MRESLENHHYRRISPGIVISSNSPCRTSPPGGQGVFCLLFVAVWTKSKASGGTRPAGVDSVSSTACGVPSAGDQKRKPVLQCRRFRPADGILSFQGQKESTQKKWPNVGCRHYKDCRRRRHPESTCATQPNLSRCVGLLRTEGGSPASAVSCCRHRRCRIVL